MKTLYLDLENGISGDMFLAALCGLGLDLSHFEEKLKQVGLITGLRSRHITRNHFMGLGLDIEESSPQPLRHLEEMFEAVKSLNLSDQVWAHIRHALLRLAEAEALAHGIPLDQVHFHEVGGVDTIIDVAGAFWGMNELGIEQVLAGPVPWFEGTAETCHGTISLPAPATLRLLENKPISGVKSDWEIITPTGALLLDCIVDDFIPFPKGRLIRHTLAFGTNPKGLGMRAYLLETQPEISHDLEWVWILESHIDHLSGEELGHALNRLMSEGALDVLFMPGITKKGRPGGLLRVICLENNLEHLENVFFMETHTLGIRRRKEARRILPRDESEVQMDGISTPLQAKTYTLAGKEFIKPEFEALNQAASDNMTTVLELKTRGFRKSNK